MSERLEKLDMSRNQFVSNASHELKTPLSTMKILLETLLYQENYDPQMQKEFLTDINKEIDRPQPHRQRPFDAGSTSTSGGMRLNVADIACATSSPSRSSASRRWRASAASSFPASCAIPARPWATA